jgi:hypothetical protein
MIYKTIGEVALALDVFAPNDHTPSRPTGFPSATASAPRRWATRS